MTEVELQILESQNVIIRALLEVLPRQADGAYEELEATALNNRNAITDAICNRIDVIDAARVAVADYKRWVIPEYGAVDGLEALDTAIIEYEKEQGDI